MQREIELSGSRVGSRDFHGISHVKASGGSRPAEAPPEEAIIAIVLAEVADRFPGLQKMSDEEHDRLVSVLARRIRSLTK